MTIRSIMDIPEFSFGEHDKSTYEHFVAATIKANARRLLPDPIVDLFLHTPCISVW
jgi:hypothetical protein